MATTRIWKIYGWDGHRQRMSFFESRSYDFSTAEKVRKIEVEAADKTGTNDYVVVKVTRDTAEECLDELNGQLDDGIFEDSRYGKVEEVTPEIVEGDKVERIRELVRRCGTQRKMANCFSIPLRSIENWCTGHRMCPGYVPLMISTILDLEAEVERLNDKIDELRRASAAAPVTPSEETHDGKKLLYIVKSRKNAASDEWDEGYCWDINEARELAQASKEHDASPYEYWIEGYNVADDYPAKAKAAYDRLSDDLSEEICWPDPDFYEVIKK